MSTHPSRVFVARLLGLTFSTGRSFRPVARRRRALPGTRGAPHVVGIVVEVPGKKRVFVPMTRITSIDQTQIICTGLVNLRRFEQRGAETLVVAEMFDRRVTLADGSDATIEDIAMDQHRSRTGSSANSSSVAGIPYRLSRLRRNETPDH